MQKAHSKSPLKTWTVRTVTSKHDFILRSHTQPSSRIRLSEINTESHMTNKQDKQGQIYIAVAQHFVDAEHSSLLVGGNSCCSRGGIWPVMKDHQLSLRHSIEWNWICVWALSELEGAKTNAVVCTEDLTRYDQHRQGRVPLSQRLINSCFNILIRFKSCWHCDFGKCTQQTFLPGGPKVSYL